MCKPKYSIIIPVHNGKRYIKDCINSITSIDYSNYEIVISDNNSDDGTYELLQEMQIQNNRIKLFRTSNFIPIEQNWNNGIKHASGEWIMILGSDDAILPFFFLLLDKLIDIADFNNINIIKTNRVYYFWNSTEIQKLYGNINISFSAINSISIKKTKETLKNGLFNDNFFEMLQMYTSCIFKNTLIKKIIKAQNDDENVIKYPSPDAYLGVLACCFEEKYLYSNIPFAWVGTSASSTGFNDFNSYKNKKELDLELYRNFDAKTYKTIHSTQLLLLGSIKSIKDNKIPIKVNIKFPLKKVLFSIIEKTKNTSKQIYLEDLVVAHKLTKTDFFLHKIKILINRKFNFFVFQKNRVINKVKRMFTINKDSKSFSITQNFYDSFSIINGTKTDIFFKNYKEINNFLKDNKIINDIINELK